MNVNYNAQCHRLHDMALRDKTLHGSDAAVCWALLQYCSADHPQAYPKPETIAAKVNRSVRTVRRSLAQLRTNLDGNGPYFDYLTGGRGPPRMTTRYLPNFHRLSMEIKGDKNDRSRVTILTPDLLLKRSPVKKVA